MARARYLKPGFFKNEGLAELRPPKTATDVPASAFAARLCFEGLWVLADRMGRLEDRPKRIKAEIFPYDRVDVEELLTALATSGFIQRYMTNGDRYIAVVTFAKHQHPHLREPPSTIPAPPSKHRASTGPARSRHDPGPAESESESESESELRTKTLSTSKRPRPVEQVLAAQKRKRGQEPRLRGRFR